MPFEKEELSDLRFLSCGYDYKSFGITGANFDETEEYGCDHDHVGAIPALLSQSSSYNPNTAEFEVKGIVVYVCPTCGNPVFNTSASL